jgi:hypothetical protein
VVVVVVVLAVFTSLVFTSMALTIDCSVTAALTPGIESTALETSGAMMVSFIDSSTNLAELASGVWISASTLTLPGVRVTETAFFATPAPSAKTS